MATPQSLTRISGIMARQARVCILFRRGPSSWCQQVLWHTDDDTFERGQWVRHRVFDFLSDVSPDGKLLVYDARDGRKRGKYEKWVAVSRPPYFTALALWPVCGPGGGGGVFEDGRRLVLYGMLGEKKKQHEMPLAVALNKPLVPESWAARDKAWFSAVELVRLHREQWRYRAAEMWWERSSKADTWRLCWKRLIRQQHPPEWGAGILHDTYVVRWDEVRWPLTGANWAAIDQRGRLVFARDGKLFAGKVTRDGVGETELADFTGESTRSAAATGVGHALAPLTHDPTQHAPTIQEGQSRPATHPRARHCHDCHEGRALKNENPPPYG